jgi:N-acetylneuraminic acid mutarotase
VTKGGWTLAGRLDKARFSHTATLLKSGKVLVTGGRNASGDAEKSSELYDPETATWKATGDLNLARWLHTATILEDGRVLVVGGYINTAPQSFAATDSAELYDPETGTWSLTGNLYTKRIWHTATRLENGKILIAGGDYGELIGAELFDPINGTWTVTGSLKVGRYAHTATLLENGMVLVVGGSDDGDFVSTLASAELYDPNTGTWSLTGSLNRATVFHTATLLPDGKVLVIGGYQWPPTSLRSAELYDPSTGGWSYSSKLNEARDGHTATLLPGGMVLIAGGEDWNTRSSLDSAELYDLAAGIWLSAADLLTPRCYHTATILNNGKVLVTGGLSNNTLNSILRSAELYVPGATVAPKIFSATVKGRKLLVAGENFDTGAVILLNGEEQKTRNDDQDLTTKLISKKAGKKLRPGDRLQVRNPDGTLSEEFTFTAS